MASAIVKILGGILIFLIIVFFITVILCISVVVSSLNEFINYMYTSFLDTFSTIETGVVEFFDILYEDVVDLID